MAGRAKADEQKREREHAGWFVVLMVTDLGESTEPGPGLKGEKLEVVDVVEAPGKSADHVAREYREQVKAAWRETRANAKPEEELPDVFPAHRWRALPLGSFMPGYYVEEERQASFGTF